jgi:hypothetical protein
MSRRHGRDGSSDQGMGRSAVCWDGSRGSPSIRRPVRSLTPVLAAATRLGTSDLLEVAAPTLLARTP